MSKPTWHYAKNRQKAGPVSLDSLKKKLSLGELGSDALVWTVGWESWKKVCDVPELTVPEPPPLPPEESPPLPAEEPPTAEKEATDPQKCPGCGYKSLPGAIRCLHCGRTLRDPESIDSSAPARQKAGQSEVKNPPLPYAVSIHGERPENYVLLTTDKQWLELLRKSKTFTFSESWISPVLAIRNIRGTLVPQESYGIVVEPAKEGADRLKRFFGGRRMLDFRAEVKLRPAATSQTPEHTNPPQIINEKLEPINGTNELRNYHAIIGLSLGIASILLSFIGSIPILAIVFSGIGLSRVRELKGKGTTQGWIGLILGILYTLSYLYENGYITL